MSVFLRPITWLCFVVTVFANPLHSEQLNTTQWELNMVTYGQVICDLMSNPRTDYQTQLRSYDYDSLWVFYQIYNYTGDSRWLNCAKAARKFYRDEYLNKHEDDLASDKLFVHGLLQDHQFYNSQKTLKALETLLQESKRLANKLALASLDNTQEVAQALMVLVTMKDNANHSQEAQDKLLNAALGHVNAWTGLQSTHTFFPYRAGITAEALIFYEQNIGDPRIQTALKQLAQMMWANYWQESTRSFAYSSQSPESAPDLNQLIAPLYAWLGYKDKDLVSQERATQIFNGGVDYAWLMSGKHFNQNYRWSFSAVLWQLMTDERQPPQTPPPPYASPLPYNPPAPSAPTVTNDPISSVAANQGIPELATWEEHMLTYGRKNCEYINSNVSFDEKLISNYY
ncbi:MAG: hypothetical protein KDD62_12145, partial [Bdellovibrionales bacterium]|nr:hypothetical protein [Bdellovibrionales bacterium]